MMVLITVCCLWVDNLLADCNYSENNCDISIGSECFLHAHTSSMFIMSLYNDVNCDATCR